MASGQGRLPGSGRRLAVRPSDRRCRVHRRGDGRSLDPPGSANAGAQPGAADAIAVDEAMRTTLPDVYAAGDCVHTHHRLRTEPTYLPLGTTAHKQGRVAGENAVGGNARFAGSLGTQVVRVFDLVAAATGDVASGWLLGAQLVGSLDAQIAKRIDILATALTYRALVTDIGTLDLSYTPPLGSPYDAVQQAADAWTVAAAGITS
ncbi:FAD-dependent oxidoreductase [Micromonospora sp. CPCC 205371]|nr:FAD-dependent oxidoreductase [Micromonospora sp. CPCC 205371]